MQGQEISLLLKFAIQNNPVIQSKSMAEFWGVHMHDNSGSVIVHKHRCQDMSIGPQAKKPPQLIRQ
jgi:hypothetical protein